MVPGPILLEVGWLYRTRVTPKPSRVGNKYLTIYRTIKQPTKSVNRITITLFPSATLNLVGKIHHVHCTVCGCFIAHNRHTHLYWTDHLNEMQRHNSCVWCDGLVVLLLFNLTASGDDCAMMKLVAGNQRRLPFDAPRRDVKFKNPSNLFVFLLCVTREPIVTRMKAKVMVNEEYSRDLFVDYNVKTTLNKQN